MRPITLQALYARGLKVLVLNGVIALAITLFDSHPLGLNLVYSYCIGTSIWAYIELANRFWVRNWQEHVRRLVLIVPAAVVLGYFTGHLLTDLLLGTTSFQYWKHTPRMAWGMLFVSLMVGAVMSWVFVNREQLAAERQRLEAARRQASEAQLKLLEAQLEPHMLFNTLANLRALISLDPPRAQAMLDHLIAFLRATLAASRTPGGAGHTLADEFARLQDYLELMAIRMGPRLHFTLELPDTLRHHPVPPLLLQPVVENCIQHGLEPQVEGGSVLVRASEAKGMLTLEVQDTGVGIAATPTLAQDEGQGKGHGFGLQQVRDRLATTFGPLGTMNLVANSPQGTRATITFPIQHASPCPPP